MIIDNAIIYDNRCRRRGSGIFAGRAPLIAAGRDIQPFVRVVCWSRRGSLIAWLGSAPEMDVDILTITLVVAVARPVTHGG
jgi:hypothetical protein